MKRLRNLIWPRGEQGSIAPIVALGLVAFAGFLALSIDLGQLFVVRNELANVADAAALAAAKQLVQPDANNNAVVRGQAATDAAVAVAAQNYSMGETGGIVVNPADVVFGQWNLSTRQFSQQGLSTDPMQCNAVQVTVRRTGQDNSQVTTFFASILGLPATQNVTATATAYLGLAGTSSIDPPFAVPYHWANGAGESDNLPTASLFRILDRLAPAPAYAGTGTKFYRWFDKGGTSLPTNRATIALSQKDKDQGQISAGRFWEYVDGTKTFPQIKVGDKLYPLSEYYYGDYNLKNFQKLQARWNAKKDPATGKWRVTVPVFNTTTVTAAGPQNSWLRLAARLIPGVSQAYACTAYSSPVIYIQGFMALDITNVVVNKDCITTWGTTQISNSKSCRNQNYLECEVPLDQSNLSQDKGSAPMPYEKSYKDMNNGASNVGTFSATPRIVK